MAKAVQFWAISFVLLFILAQLLDTLQEVPLPFPILVIAGLGLAIGSNYDKRRLMPLGIQFLLNLPQKKP